MASTPGNPDFSLDAKRKIVKATRIALAIPEAGANDARTRHPRGGEGLFYVKLQQDGGSAGSSSAACTFTYSVKDVYDDTTIETTIAVKKDRLLVCAMNAATLGWAYYDENGDLQIWDCNETAQTQNC